MTDFKLAIIKLAAYYEKDLSDEQILMYSEQLSGSLNIEELKAAIKFYIDDPKNEFFPRPVSKLISIIKSPVSAEDVSQNISSLLMAAEKKYGVHWASGFMQDGEIVYQGKDCAFQNWRHAAVSVFGPTGLQVVDRYGGWKEFCVNIYESPDGVVRAQVKNLATSLQNIMTKTGSYDYLDSKPSSPGLTHVSKLLSFSKTDKPK